MHVSPELKRFVRNHGQLVFDIGLAVFFTIVVAHETWKTWVEGRMNYVEIAFAIQNVVMIGFILLRTPHKEVDRSIPRQAVAMVAFFSGMAFIGQPQSGGPAAQAVSNVVIFAANVFGIATLLNLGRSFGILIACREIKTGWLYAVVRHPMYGTDILLRIGYMITHTNWFTVLLFVVSTGAYVLRAMLEERFLSRQPEYRAYMRKVRYRFIPGVF